MRCMSIAAGAWLVLMNTSCGGGGGGLGGPTAQEINASLEATLRSVAGDWTGMAFEALQEVPGWQAWNQFRGTAPTPGGETMLEALGRALRCLARWGQAVPDGDVVLVSHQDVLKAVLAHSLGAPLDLMQRIELGAGSCSVVRVFGNGEVRVEAINFLT